MGKDENDNTKIEDVEEGEISDAASLEEISEEDFNNKQEIKVVEKEKQPKSKDPRVWTMKDLYEYKYQVGGGYVSGLYNLAWAQAVQNKPLNDLFVEVEPDDNSKRSSPSLSVASVNSCSNNKEEKKVVEKVEIVDSGDEMEKEEGELEEGEIDLDSEPVEKSAEAAGGEAKDSDVMMVDDDSYGVKSREKELEEKVKSIGEALESVTLVEAEKSFETVCSKLYNTLESLREVVRENNVPTNDALTQLLFTAIGAVNSVFCSMNHKLKEQNKEKFARLFSLVNCHKPPLFSPEQIKEIEAMVSFSEILLNARPDEKAKETQVYGALNKKDNDHIAKSAGLDLTIMDKLSSAAQSAVHNKLNMSIEAPKSGVSNFKSRGVMLPLLDLHKDHDADSLPSPTREATPSLPVHRLLAVGDGMIKAGLPNPKMAHDNEGSKMHPYETDALKAVSSYQQKFGRSSFFTNDSLPSPTPSEESNDGDGDTGGEVSSSSSFRAVNPPILGQPIPSSASASASASPSPSLSLPVSSSIQGVASARNAPPISSGSSSMVKSSAKSRDPRLRYVNADTSALGHNQHASPLMNNTPKVEPGGDMMSSRKHKSIEDPIPDGPSLKRQRNALENSGVVRDLKMVTGSGGWLEDTDVVGPQNQVRNNLAEKAESDPRRTNNGIIFPTTGNGKSNESIRGNEQTPVIGIGSVTGSQQGQVTSTTMTSLPDLLKDIAVNPTMLINILKLGQQQKLELEAEQKLADPAKNTAFPPSSNSILGALPGVNFAPLQSSGILLRPAGTLQAPSQGAPMDELGKIRMKPRDPRRILHNNALQRPGSMGTEQLKTNVTSTSTTKGTKDNQNEQKEEGQADTKPVLSLAFVLPDISLPFTKSLKNIADIVSVSQASTAPPSVSQNVAPQPPQILSERVDVKTVISNSDQQNGTGSAPEVVAAGPRAQNTWGDVEHLFEGYDDQQKAAIQRERARRMEEQKKMFAARKLCLVLDLDHTLLNSAKFVEVDPVHDEILRKKEEQDREKPYRHLFRFPHMGMWTKLRPGIWNFLEKASKLYELHLYTMGNKLYATEMAKLLDPKGVLFAGRVISRGDDGDPFDSDERVPKSKDLEGVLGMESAVVIIDDSVRVWPHNKLNLIVVERYIFFPCSRRQFGLPGPSLLEIDHDERPDDGTLACSLSVIERIHQNFFSHHSLDEADVRNILASEQRKILSGCRIVFSRVFPVGEANPHLHPLWQTAEQFGAVCTNQIDEQVTHVVANSLGTDKVNWALSMGRFVVHPGWVEASALLYRRANEQDFAIKP